MDRSCGSIRRHTCSFPLLRGRYMFPGQFPWEYGCRWFLFLLFPLVYDRNCFSVGSGKEPSCLHGQRGVRMQLSTKRAVIYLIFGGLAAAVLYIAYHG